MTVMLLTNQVHEPYIISFTYKSAIFTKQLPDWEIIFLINKSGTTRHTNYWYES